MVFSKWAFEPLKLYWFILHVGFSEIHQPRSMKYYLLGTAPIIKEKYSVIVQTNFVHQLWLVHLPGFHKKEASLFAFVQDGKTVPLLSEKARGVTQWWKNTCRVSSCHWHGLPVLLQLLAELSALSLGNAGLGPQWGLCLFPWNGISRSNWLYC